ncbi:unnamed protein product [Rhizophagus irregularis]|uniref:Uncharacterized protein n=1 Tax=Rhizophagus irregularis TaxID=588596 RepID=A0A915YYV7_9GLOM|nr:unnamed protein product [Rhizophagus irregularis]CAB5353802.1 unnamed protein product [Rhizophagus irregularis]
MEDSMALLCLDCELSGSEPKENNRISKFITYKYAKAHCNQPRNQSKRKLQVMENKEQKEIISVNYNSKILFSSDDVIYSTDEILEPLKHLGKGGPSSKRL